MILRRSVCGITVDAAENKSIQGFSGRDQIQGVIPMSNSSKGFSSAPGRIELLADAAAEEYNCSNESELLHQADYSLTVNMNCSRLIDESRAILDCS